MNNIIFQTIKSKCEKALAEYYPTGVPAPAAERLKEELKYLEQSGSDTLDDFALYRELAEAAARGGFEIMVVGTTGGSILVFLLGDRRINPLPAHYYCKHCGHYEQADGYTFGLDLPQKPCPKCGTALSRDGFSLPIESVWNSSPDFEYRIPSAFRPFFNQIVRQHYDRISRSCIELSAPSGSDSKDSPPKYKWDGYAVLPSGMHEADIEDALGRTKDGHSCIDTLNYYDL